MVDLRTISPVRAADQRGIDRICSLASVTTLGRCHIAFRMVMGVMAPMPPDPSRAERAVARVNAMLPASDCADTCWSVPTAWAPCLQLGS